MASSLASQLQAIKSFVQADSDQSLKRPFTRPSLLFDPKEAADIDVDTILSVALQGLELLMTLDERFRNYKNDLFSLRSKEMDRELMGIEENNRINATISSYLRLVSVYFQHPSVIKTLEYLIRRYKIYVYNFEELILCSLPYHETHIFVRIVQLINPGNSKWHFLNGVKLSGAPPPRKVIVDQCLRDKGVLEVLCNYASPSKKHHPSRPVISFCTSVIIEALGSATTIDNDVVTRILPFVNSGLHPDAKGGSDHKAGSLMIVGLLASKVTMSPKLVNTLIRLVAEIARDDAKESADLQWVRSSLLTMINLIQMQSVDLFPRKALELLMEIRDFPGLLSELFKEFKIDKFLSLVLDSLADYSFSDESCQHALISILEVTPIKDFVPHMVAKVLGYCLRTTPKNNASPNVSGQWVKQLLSVLRKKYPSEVQGAIHKFLQEKNVRSEKGNPTYEVLGNILDGNLEISQASFSHSKLWFALHHPEADVRRAVLSGLSTASILETRATDPQGFSSVQDAILRQLHDDDLSVVGAAISLDGLTDMIDSSDLLRAVNYVLKRCIDILYSRPSQSTSLACDVALSCLKKVDFLSHDHEDWLHILGAMICPLLLILPKTQRLNLKALESAKNLNWQLYENLPSVPNTELVLQSENMYSINMDIITCLAETILMQPEARIASLAGSCKDFESSKSLFFLVLMQSLLMQKNKSGQYVELLEASYPMLKNEWQAFESLSDASFKELNSDALKKWDCKEFLAQLAGFKFKALNAQILVCTFWRLLEGFELSVSAEELRGDNKKWISRLEDLFVFFCVSKFNHVFKEHRLYLSSLCKSSSLHFLMKFFTEQDFPAAVQVESLHCYLHCCSQSEVRLQAQFLSEFPSILVPLASDNQDVRAASMNCIEGLRALWGRIDYSSKRNGNHVIWSQFLDKVLDSIIQQKRLILSDGKFLPSLMVSLLSSSGSSLLVPKITDQRFDQATRERVLAFIVCSALKLSDYAKLMILSLLKGVGSAIMRIKELESFLSQLLKRRNHYQHELGTPSLQLSNVEVEILCILLEICGLPPQVDHVFGDYILEALKLDDVAIEDPAFIRPCVTVLHKLNDQIFCGLKSDMQERLFHEVVVLFRSNCGDIQSAAKEALLRLSISCSTVVETLDQVLNSSSPMITSEYRKKKRKLVEHQKSNLPQDVNYKGENVLSFLSSLLDVLLLKKDITERDLLLGSLFKLVGKTFSDEWIHSILDKSSVQVSSDVYETAVATVSDIQQRLLILLVDISNSLPSSSLKKEVVNQINVKVLVECARSAKDGVTQNHIFSLISSLAKIIPEKVLEHVEEIFTVIGESTITQVDRHSQHVFEDLISTIVPYWLQRTKNMDTLLQIFMNVLPEVADHRRLSIVVYLLRTLGESDSLASLLVLLFRSLVSRKGSSFFENKDAVDSCIVSTKREWEYVFTQQICEQYSCLTWLPSLVVLLQQVGKDTLRQEMFLEIMFIIQFTQNRLQDPEFILKLESEEDSENIQSLLEDLMEQVGFLIQLLDTTRKKMTAPAKIKKDLKDSLRAVFRTITSLMVPSACFKGIITLLHHADKNVGKKALGLLCEMVREQDVVKSRRKGRSIVNSQWKNMDTTSLENFRKLCLEIVKIIDNSGDVLDSLKLGAISALEVLANKLPVDISVFSECLGSITKYIKSDNLAVSSSCMRATGALVNVLGPRALAELPRIMKNVISVSHETALCTDIKAVKIVDDTPAAFSQSKESIVSSVLFVFEAVVDKLGGFLNPYLGDVITVLVLNPDYASDSDLKIKLKADTVRKLITEKIPVRLALPPMLKIFPSVVSAGDSSLIVYFEMLANLIGIVDRQSVGAHHTRIFELCLLALDLRRQQPISLKQIDVVENCVITTLISLTMKLTETMFKPLFVRSIEWAESDVEDGEHARSDNIDRAISFYGLVNKLVENHRSLFVPYFKYLLQSCVRHLTASGETKVSGPTKKKKRAKITDAEENSLSAEYWQLRTLVLSSLHKCFLYDSGSLKFLDSSNFQVLLKPVVSQIAAEPPISLQENPSLPSINEVDDLVVNCIGQMAVAAGNDELWKPLNHEVLMQTRSENVRSRILALRVVRFMVENLREEYLVFLAQTIPFLGELLEDVEPSVKSLTQDILKEMESLSGESLRQYL